MKTEKMPERFKYKETINPQKLAEILRQWADALETNEDLHLSISNQEVNISKDTFQLARIEAEYELKNGEYELEIEMKWDMDSASKLRKDARPISNAGLKRDEQDRYQ